MAPHHSPGAAPDVRKREVLGREWPASLPLLSRVVPDPRVRLGMIGVSDLERAIAFYRDGLG